MAMPDDTGPEPLPPDIASDTHDSSIAGVVASPALLLSDRQAERRHKLVRSLALKEDGDAR